MYDDLPQDEYFEWEDIISYRPTPVFNPTRKPVNLSISPTQEMKDDLYDYDSEWSESECGASVGGFSVADSLSTQTTTSLNALEDCSHFDEDANFLPSYEDVTTLTRISASPTNSLTSLGSSQPNKPEEIERAEDDSAVLASPSKHVDFLSHDWCEDDVWATWKYLKSTRKIYNNRERLMNASWRLWMKERHQLDTTEPQTINWMKDRDTTWLYGPVQTGSTVSDEALPATSISRSLSMPISPINSIKPILKKPSLSLTLLRKSISSAALARQAKAAQEAELRAQKNKISPLPHGLVVEVRRSTAVEFVPAKLKHHKSTPAKTVRFHDELEQPASTSSSISRSSSVQSIFEMSSEDDEQEVEMDEDDDDEEPSAKALITAITTASHDLHLDTDQESEDGEESESDLHDFTTSSCNSEVSDDEAVDYLGSLSNGGKPVNQNVAASFLDPVREDLVELVMDEFWTIFNQEWDANVNQCTRGSGRSPGESSRGSSLTTQNTTTYTQRKRQRANDDESSEENDNHSRQPQQPTPRRESNDVAKFACPFRKHDSQTYNIYTHRVCALSHWQTIARVKEHIYRCHQKLPHCKRCWASFKNQQQLDAHITVAASDICEVTTGEAPEGITPAMERQLRSRKKSHPGQTDEDRWRDIYKLLFPGADIPSPYFEAVSEEGPSSPDSRELANYENYIRRELPRLVRRNIESVVQRETQPLEAALIGNLVGIIQDCQDRVFRSYRETQGIDNGIFTPPPVATPSLDEMWSSETPDFHPDLDFLSAFQAPLPSRAQSHLSFQQLDSVLRPDALGFSDSGYASEPTCSCQGLCSCSKVGLGIDMKVPDELGSVVADSNIARPWVDSLSHPTWHAEDDADEAHFWMNV